MSSPAATNHQQPLHISLISTNTGHWGGSEELWSSVANRLLNDGHAVQALLSRPQTPHPKIDQLRDQGLSLAHLAANDHPLPQRIWNRISPARFVIPPGIRFKKTLIQSQPDLVLISMGSIVEDMSQTSFLRQQSIPYAVLIQQASEIDSPVNTHFAETRDAINAAFAVFFVSKANQKIVQDQLGLSLPDSTVICNSVKTKSPLPLPWPTSSKDSFALACPARLVLRDKGQDLLVSILAHEKWKRRNLRISLFGEGRHSESLKQMADYLGVSSIRQEGHTSNIEDVWKTHHGCILPSRVEGLPLTLVEAMWYGRPAIVTDVGGNAEVLRDGATGFIATNPSEQSLDEAMERAWQRRDEWEEMGKLAAKEIRSLIPSDPARTFTNLLIERFKQRA